MTSKLVLVTGASSGIGAALARRLARDGVPLVLTARRLDRLETLAGELETRHHVPVSVISNDLGRPESPAALVEELDRRGIEVEWLVNNAGFGTMGHFHRLPLERELTMEVRGRDLIAGLPRTIPITSSEVMEAIEIPLQQLVAAVRGVLEQTPPELSSDIIDKGMVMSGGGSLLRNIDKLLTQVTGVPCHVAENPLSCVALGTGLALEHFDFFKKSLVQQV